METVTLTDPDFVGDAVTQPGVCHVMSELRQDIVTGLWVAFATDRAARPSDFPESRISLAYDETEKCPLCSGHEIMTPLEVFAIRPEGGKPNTPGWRVRVVPNKFPVFCTGEKFLSGESLFPRRSAEGSHEVIIHSPSHSESLGTMPVEDVELVLRVWRHRYSAVAVDERVRDVHIIVNHGQRAGSSLEHSHSQLFGMPVVPPLLQQELAGASWHHSHHGECVFCRIISSELEASRRVIAKNGSFVAIAPFASRFPFEVWIIPRDHQESYDMIKDSDLEEFAPVVRDVLGKYHEKFGDTPYNCYMHSAPTDGSKYPYYHWHAEMFPRFTTHGGFEIGTSMMINVTTPELAADYLTGRASP